jgi:heterodisulfide reductase subunit C
LTATAPLTTQKVSFLQEVIAATPGDSRLDMCIQCGTCGGSCPSGADMQHSPRAIFAMIREGMREQVLRSNTMWFCVSCYFCVVRCPQEIHITDLMYALKAMAIREGLCEVATAAGLSQTFTDQVENYGRSFEFGLATRHNLRYRPLALPGMTQLGLGMLTKRRMGLAPHRIEHLEQLQAILRRAKELEEATL